MFGQTDGIVPNGKDHFADLWPVAMRIASCGVKPGQARGLTPTDRHMTLPVPIPDSYWLVDDWLLAGEYPGAWRQIAARRRLQMFLGAGIRSFIDLTEADEPLQRYDELLAEVGRHAGVECRHQRFAIPDAGLPSPDQMRTILDAIRAEIDAGRPVYVHCWGGIGRTGTVAGCWLVEQGLSGDDALERIRSLRAGTPDRHTDSPQNFEQAEFVRTWVPGELPRPPKA